MIQFQENPWTDGRKKRKEGRPYFIRTFRLPLGVQKESNNFSCEKNEKKKKKKNKMTGFLKF